MGMLTAKGSLHHMEFQRIHTQHPGQSSEAPDHYSLAGFEDRFYIFMCLGNGTLGALVDEQINKFVYFDCRDEARRFCAARNRVEKRRVARLHPQ